MNEETLSYEQIFTKLHEERVRYLVIGGVAVNLYGISRATGDIDLMIAFDEDNVVRLSRCMKALGMVPRVPVETEELADARKRKAWREEKHMLVFSFTHPSQPYITIDIMTEEYLDFEKAYRDRNDMKAWGISVSVIGIENLLKLKRIAGRQQDLADIEALKKYGEAT